LNKREIFEKVRAIVVEQLCIEPDLVTLVANFAKDLGADSLDTVELVMALEATFNIEIPNEIAQTFMTVQQVIDYVSKKVAVAV
jgi:acyl carrier protein